MKMEQASIGRRDELYRLLDERNKSPEKRKEIDELIRRKFEKSMAIMITDSVGFSRKTREYGIIHFLTLLRKVNSRIRPIIQSHEGRILSEWADNFVISFDQPLQAVNAAVAINQHISAYNPAVAEEDRFGICIGIGYGTVLYVENDIFGQEVNLASKLGEDIARDGEILLTEAAYECCEKGADYPLEFIEHVEVSGISFKYYRVNY